MKLENIQVEQISNDNFRIITNKGQYLQANSKLVAFISNEGKKHIIRYYYSCSNSTINALSKFFGLSRSNLMKAYKEGSIDIFA